MSDARILLDVLPARSCSRRQADPSAHRPPAGQFEIEGWLDCIRDLCSADDAETQQKAALALVRLTEPMSGVCAPIRIRICSELTEWLQPLMYLAQSSDSASSEAAEEVLGRIGVYGHQTLLALVKQNGYDALRYLASCSQLKAQRSAAAVITSLLHEDRAQRSKVVREIGLRTVVRLAVSEDEFIKTVAAMAVECVHSSVLLSHEQFPRLVEQDGVGAICALAADGSHPADGGRPLQSFAAAVLRGVLGTEVFECHRCNARPIMGSRNHDVLAAPEEDGTIAQMCDSCAAQFGEAAGGQLAAIPVDAGLLAKVAAAGGVAAHCALLEAGRDQKLAAYAAKNDDSGGQVAAAIAAAEQAAAGATILLTFDEPGSLGITFGSQKAAVVGDSGAMSAVQPVVVREVDANSAAARAGSGRLKPNMRLVSVQGAAVGHIPREQTIAQVRAAGRPLVLGFAPQSEVIMPAFAEAPQAEAAAHTNVHTVEALLLPVHRAQLREGRANSKLESQTSTPEEQLQLLVDEHAGTHGNSAAESGAVVGLDLEVVGLCGLADLAAAPESAHYLLRNGAPALRLLVAVSFSFFCCLDFEPPW